MTLFLTLVLALLVTSLAVFELAGIFGVFSDARTRPAPSSAFVLAQSAGVVATTIGWMTLVVPGYDRLTATALIVALLCLIAARGLRPQRP